MTDSQSCLSRGQINGWHKDFYGTSIVGSFYYLRQVFLKFCSIKMCVCIYEFHRFV